MIQPSFSCLSTQQDVDQKVVDLEEEIENPSLNNDIHYQQDLQIATRNEK